VLRVPAAASRREGPAITLLGVFVRQVQRFIDRGFLTPEEGEPLIDEAIAIVEQLEAA
jgi:hypothetical protein